jgi:hypothetical protein
MKLKMRQFFLTRKALKFEKLTLKHTLEKENLEKMDLPPNFSFVFWKRKFWREYLKFNNPIYQRKKAHYQPLERVLNYPTLTIICK